MKALAQKGLTATLIAAAAAPALAGEGGGSNYLQATYGDFQAAVWDPTGLYMRNNSFFYDGDIGVRPLGGASTAARMNNYLSTSSLFPT